LVDEKQRKDLVVLAASWAKHSAHFRAAVAAEGGLIKTVDNGVLQLVNGQWEVVESGEQNEAGIIRNDLHKRR
jgi:hypothetical protein